MEKGKQTYKLPEGWIWTTIGDIGIVQSGGTPSTRNKEFWEGEISWITPADLSGYKGKYISKGKRSISKLGLDYSSAKLLPKGTILFSSRAPIGYTVIAKNELATNQGFKNLIPTKSLNSEYVYYYFQTLKPKAEKVASGTTFLELSATKFSQLPFPLAPLQEQERIVSKIESLFSELDHAEKGLQIAKQQLEVYRQAILKLSFEKDKDWKSYRFDDIFDFIDGDRGKNYPKRGDYKENGYCLFLSTQNVRLNYFDFSNRVYLTKEKHNSLRNGLLEYDDIIITTRGTIGNVALYDKSISEPVVRINSSMLILRLKQKDIIPKFITTYIISPSFRSKILKEKTGTAQPQLPSFILKQFEISIPPISTQEQIIKKIEFQVSIIENIESLINILLLKAVNLRYSILKKAFTGELIPQDSLDKLVSELLKQIKAEKEIYLKNQIDSKKNAPKKIKKMSKELSIEEVLKNSTEPMPAKEVWQNSKHKDNIEDFYAELKELGDKVKEVKKGLNSLISLKQ